MMPAQRAVAHIQFACEPMSLAWLRMFRASCEGTCLPVGLLCFKHGLHLATLTSLGTGGGPGFSFVQLTLTQSRNARYG